MFSNAQVSCASAILTHTPIHPCRDVASRAVPYEPWIRTVIGFEVWRSVDAMHGELLGAVDDLSLANDAAADDSGGDVDDLLANLLVRAQHALPDTPRSRPAPLV